MSHISAAAYLVWSIVCVLFGCFLLFHLWSFDHFKCLKWNSGPYSGAFKRVMTYSYLLTIPLLGTYAIGNAIIKYREGFVQLPGVGIIAKPFQLWTPAERNTIFPLTLCFSIGWSLEMVTHLEGEPGSRFTRLPIPTAYTGIALLLYLARLFFTPPFRLKLELCFWLYLVNSTSSHQDWFKSLYFRTWVIGSAIAVAYLPIITIFTRSDPLKSETWTFLAGSLGSLSLTLWFTPILYMFPSFLKSLRREGVEMATIVRLTKFEELNRIRVLFRFVFCVPLLILGINGLRPHHHLNESMVWTDILTILPAFGIAISSGITLVIFFPRSIEGEIAARDAEKERLRSRLTQSASYLGSRESSRMTTTNMSGTHSFDQRSRPIAEGHDMNVLTSSPMKMGFRHGNDSFDSDDDSRQGYENRLPNTADKLWNDDEVDGPAALPHTFKPNRRRGRDTEFGGLHNPTESSLSVSNMRTSNVNPMVHGFTSPINLGYAVPAARNSPRYAFGR